MDVADFKATRFSLDRIGFYRGTAHYVYPYEISINEENW